VIQSVLLMDQLLVHGIPPMSMKNTFRVACMRVFVRSLFPVDDSSLFLFPGSVLRVHSPRTTYLESWTNNILQDWKSGTKRFAPILVKTLPDQ
jgi:hypothetical protein